MFIDLPPSPTPPPGAPGDLPACLRVDARLALTVRREDGRLRVAERREAGAFRFRMPGRAPDAIEALMVNVAGGLAGGDRLRLAVEAGPGAALVIGSAAAERIYRSGGDETAMIMALRAGEGARLAWLPAETILHDGARLVRDFDIRLATGSRFLLGEMVQMGRVASGEGFATGDWRDRWRLRIGGRLVFAEEFHLAGGLDRPGGLAGCAFMGTIVLAMPEARERLGDIRAAFEAEPRVKAGASAHSGLVFARALASDDVALRRAFLAAIRAAAGGDLPLSRLLMLQ